MGRVAARLRLIRGRVYLSYVGFAYAGWGGALAMVYPSCALPPEEVRVRKVCTRLGFGI